MVVGWRKVEGSGRSLELKPAELLEDDELRRDE